MLVSGKGDLKNWQKAPNKRLKYQPETSYLGGTHCWLWQFQSIHDLVARGNASFIYQTLHYTNHGVKPRINFYPAKICLLFILILFILKQAQLARSFQRLLSASVLGYNIVKLSAICYCRQSNISPIHSNMVGELLAYVQKLYKLSLEKIQFERLRESSKQI